MAEISISPLLPQLIGLIAFGLTLGVLAIQFGVYIAKLIASMLP